MIVSRRFRRRCAQVALALAFVAFVATIVAASGGFAVRYSWLRLSLRSPLNPAIATVVALSLAWLLASRDDRRSALLTGNDAIRGTRGPLRFAHQHAHPVSRWAVVAIAMAVVATAAFAGSFVASGADAYGYLSQVDLWLQGSFIVRQEFAREMNWPSAAESLAPLGYLPRQPIAAHRGEIVPIYSPGHPLVMALMQLAVGPAAKFAVVPILSGVAVWATYLMGLRFAGPLVGVAAAILLASSPVFLFEAVSPTSDAPNTAWWALVFGCLLLPGRKAAVGAGLAAGIAVLTRPNVVFLTAILGAMLVWQWVSARARTNADPSDAAIRDRSDAFARMLLFAAGVLPACLIIGAINWQLHGSPLQSGYGALRDVLSWSHLSENLARYPRWLLEHETPIVLLACVPLLVARRTAAEDAEPLGPRLIAVAWACGILAVAVFYQFYLPEFSNLRFLLPAYPALLVLASAGLVTVLSPLHRLNRAAPGLLTLVVAAAVAWHGIGYARRQHVFDYWRSELRYEALGRYVAESFPPRAAILSMQHSGSLRYYSGRLTLRYDRIPPTELDAVLDRLRQLGYYPYIALDDWEEAPFRERFSGHSTLAPLDWMPVAFVHSNRVRVYDPSDRQPGRSDRQRVPDVVPNPANRRRLP